MFQCLKKTVACHFRQVLYSDIMIVIQYTAADVLLFHAI